MAFAHQDGLDKLQARLKVYPNGPRLPIEVGERIVSFVPPHNKLELSCSGWVYVDGILPYAVFHLSLLLPHLPTPFRTWWTLDDIAHKTIKKTIFRDPSFANSLKLSANALDVPLKYVIPEIQSAGAFHLLRNLKFEVSIYRSFTQDIGELAGFWPPYLEKLCIKGRLTHYDSHSTLNPSPKNRTQLLEITEN